MDKPSDQLTELTERLQHIPDDPSWRLQVNEIGTELLALSAGDEPIWGIHSVRMTHDRDTELVRRVGRVVFSSSTYPMTYRDAEMWRDELNDPKSGHIRRFIRTIVPFEEAEKARAEYVAECEAMNAVLQKERKANPPEKPSKVIEVPEAEKPIWALLYTRRANSDDPEDIRTVGYVVALAAGPVTKEQADCRRYEIAGFYRGSDRFSARDGEIVPYDEAKECFDAYQAELEVARTKMAAAA